MELEALLSFCLKSSGMDGGGLGEEMNKAELSSLPICCELGTNQLLTKPAVAGSGSLAELKPRIHCHRWGGVAVWMKCKKRLSSTTTS